MVAVVTGSLPRFAGFRPILPQEPPRNLSGAAPIPDSPVYGQEPFQVVLSGSAFSDQCIQMLQDMRDLTDGQEVNQEEFRQRIHKMETHPPSPPSSLICIIQQTSIIYQRAFLTPSIPFESPLNHHAVRSIAQCLENTSNDTTWVRFPGILLWIILNAASAALYLPERSFFVMWLIKVGTGAAWWGAEEAKEAVLRFVRVKRGSRVDGDAVLALGV